MASSSKWLTLRLKSIFLTQRFPKAEATEQRTHMQSMSAIPLLRMMTGYSLAGLLSSPFFGWALLFSLLALPLGAQERIFFDQSCTYTGEITDEGIYGFRSDKEATEAIERIMRYTGLPANFKIQASNVPNAAAIIQGNRRYILYNQYFMERIKDITRTDWSALSIMAHEIGHHLSGHTLDNEGSRPSKELEADRFSGFVLYKMGASIEQSRAAMRAIASEKASSTHPSKSARLAAITNGWMSARELDENIKPIENQEEISRPKPLVTSAPEKEVYAVHGMLHSQHSFPNLKSEMNRGRYFMDGFKLLNRWNVITGPKPDDYLNQMALTRVNFPEKEIQQYWDLDFRITTLRYAEDIWLLVMTEFDRVHSQRWRKSSSFPKEEIKTGWAEDYYLTNVAYGDGEWVAVMDKQPAGFLDQRYDLSDKFPGDRIKELWDEGYNITSLRYLNDKWVLVMTRFEKFRHQLWRTRSQFPKSEIIENEKRGYVVTEVSYGNNVWSLVMTKQEGRFPSGERGNP